MYLSRLILNPRNRNVRRDIADPGEMHRTILHAFPPMPEPIDFRHQNGVLYRLDIHTAANLPTLLVQSARSPDWTFLDKEYLQLGYDDNPAVKDVSEPYASIQKGQTLSFRLRANVTRKIDTKTGPDGLRRNGKRVPLRKIQEQIQWIVRKGQEGGFEPLVMPLWPDTPDLRITSETDKTAQKKKDATKTVMTFAAVLFEGRLKVTDAEVFMQTLQNGIGSAKAYGFGLMSIGKG